MVENEMTTQVHFRSTEYSYKSNVGKTCNFFVRLLFKFTPDIYFAIINIHRKISRMIVINSEFSNLHQLNCGKCY